MIRTLSVSDREVQRRPLVRCTTVVSAAVTMMLVGVVTAQEPAPRAVLVTLTDGSSFEATVPGRKKKKDRVFSTVLGKRRVRGRDVALTRSSGSMQEAYRALPRAQTDGVEAHEKRLKWCRARGLTSGVAHELAWLLEHDPENVLAWQVARREAPHYELVRNTQPRGRPRWARAQIDALYEKVGGFDRAKAALVVAQLEGLDAAAQFGPAVKWLRRGRKTARWTAAHRLASYRKPERVKPLYRSALLDRDPLVRRQAVLSLKTAADAGTTAIFVNGLFKNSHANVVHNAVEALELLGDRRAAPALVAAMKATEGAGYVRNHIAVLTQIAYVKDFDVEIAQAAVIADPVVDRVQEGVVHDVAVVSVTQLRRRIGRALNRLTGHAGRGLDAAGWRRWLKSKSTL